MSVDVPYGPDMLAATSLELAVELELVELIDEEAVCWNEAITFSLARDLQAKGLRESGILGSGL